MRDKQRISLGYMQSGLKVRFDYSFNEMHYSSITLYHVINKLCKHLVNTYCVITLLV
jgi:hypothetical protein